MKIKICEKNILATELLLQIVSSLYESKPSAKLLHADVETLERPHDGSNVQLVIKGKFTVGVTDVVKIELNFITSYFKHVAPDWKGRKDWEINSCYVSEPQSGKNLSMIMYEDKPTVWNGKGERGEFLKLILAQ